MPNNFIMSSSNINPNIEPLIILNLTTEMLYVLNQRMVAQSIPYEKQKQVIAEIINKAFEKNFMEKLYASNSSLLYNSLGPSSGTVATKDSSFSSSKTATSSSTSAISKNEANALQSSISMTSNSHVKSSDDILAENISTSQKHRLLCNLFQDFAHASCMRLNTPSIGFGEKLFFLTV